MTLEGDSPAAIAGLLDEHGYARATLEPGDGTSYKLHIIHSSPSCLLVLRDIGGRPAVAFVPAAFSDFDLKPLTNGNGWTGQVLRWWLGLLIEEMGDAA